jgi:hypothetical protein
MAVLIDTGILVRLLERTDPLPRWALEQPGNHTSQFSTRSPGTRRKSLKLADSSSAS